MKKGKCSEKLGEGANNPH